MPHRDAHEPPRATRLSRLHSRLHSVGAANYVPRPTCPTRPQPVGRSRMRRTAARAQQKGRPQCAGGMQSQAIGLPCREPCTTQRTPSLSRLSSSRREIYSTPTVCTHQQHPPTTGAARCRTATTQVQVHIFVDPSYASARLARPSMMRGLGTDDGTDLWMGDELPACQAFLGPLSFVRLALHAYISFLPT